MERKKVDLEQLLGFKDVLTKLVENPEFYKGLVEAFEKDDSKRFRELLEEHDLVIYCWIICRWLCIKIRGAVCITLCPGFEPRELTFDEILEFSQEFLRLLNNERIFRTLFEAYRREDVERFKDIIEEYKITLYCPQICRWFTGYYCIEKCRIFCPPVADITYPNGNTCIQPVAHQVDGEYIVGVEIKGIASGGSPFSNYRLDYSTDNGVTWRQDAPGSGDVIIVYPDGQRGGVTPNPVGPPPDTLGYLDTSNLSAQTISVKLTVTGGGMVVWDAEQFSLHLKSVHIDEVGRIDVTVVGGTRKLVLGGVERAVGGLATIGGSALVEGCGHRYRKYKLMLAPGWIAPPVGADYDTIGAPWEILKDNYGNDLEVDYTGKPSWTFCWDNRPIGDLSAKWIKSPCHILGFPILLDRLVRDPWQSRISGTTTRSGKYTLLLLVQDDDSPPNTYHDHLQVWVDNRDVKAEIQSVHIKGEKPKPFTCETYSIADIMKAGGVMEIFGTAWDELIDDSLPDTQPNLNFDYYTLRWKKDGGTYQTTGITLTNAGKKRITDGVLATWDIRNPLDPTKPLSIITPCSYIFQLTVRDNSRVNDSWLHEAQFETGICITE
jgi:hypothetical protein